MASIDIDAVLRQHAPLVRSMARQMAMRLPANVEADDLVQAGMIGMLDALARFDAAQGVQFRTFASHRIRGAMVDEVRAADWASREDRQQMNRIQATAHQLRRRLCREPRQAEMAEALGMTAAEYAQAEAQALAAPVLLHDLAHDQGADFLDRHAACQDTASAAEQIDAARYDEWMRSAIDALPARERFIVCNVMAGHLDQQDVAVVLGVSPARVSNLQAQAVARIRARVQAAAGGKAQAAGVTGPQ
jgi:RNA polymerase sigma factor for flagellar operon FliA